MKHKLMFKLLMVTVALFATCGLGMADSFVLTGPYLNVGLSNTGGLGYNGDSGPVGLQFDKTGTGSFATAPDLLPPGLTLEFYAIGINGNDLGAGGYLFSGNPNYPMTSTKVAPLIGSTAGLVGGLTISTQTTVVSAKEVLFDVDFINFTSAPITNVQYARGLNPIPDYTQFESFNTIDTVSAGKVTALGPLSGIAISILDLTGFGIPSVQSPPWATDLATLSIPSAPGTYAIGQNTINMYWNLGTIAPFGSKEISFEYELSAVPLPPSLLLFAPGLFGLVGLRKRFFG